MAAAEAEWVQDAQRNYLLPRQDSHAWLQLSGVHGSAVMAKLCGVDLRAEAFPVGAVAQTSAARINVIVVNVGSDERPALQLLFDRASLAYLREAMLDAMDEFDGGLIGLGELIG
ncbi:Sarcosine oxidase, gamma subunit family [compost metagenome]